MSSDHELWLRMRAACLSNYHAQIALRISLSYALLASGWNFVFDRLLAMFVANPQQLTRLSTYKGVSFVVVSTLLLYTLLWRAFRAQRDEATNRRLAESHSLQRLTAV